MIGYIFFVITTLFYIGLAMLTASKPNLVGDSAMGYGLGLFFLGIGFAVSSLALTITLISKGGFVWLGNDAGIRTSIALLFWLAVALTTFFCAVFKWEWHNDDNAYPQFLRWLAVNHGQVWIPLLWMIACFLVLYANGQSGMSPNAYKIPFFAGLLITTVFSGGLVVGYLRDSAMRFDAKVASQKEEDDKWHRQNLDYIASQKPTDPIINLLSYSTRFRPEDTREAANAKIKAHPDWEAEILALLTDKRAYREVYYFLDGNKVTHSERFAEPLNQSIVWLSETIAADIEDSNNLQHWSFDSYGVGNVLRAIDDQFPGKGADFYPNVLKLRQALKTTPPERFKNVRFTVTDEVEAWLEVHRK